MLPRRQNPIENLTVTMDSSLQEENRLFNMRVLRLSAFGVFQQGFSVMRHAKHVFKDRMLYETNQLQQFERLRNTTLKKIAECESTDEKMKAFHEGYKDELQSKLNILQMTVSEISAVGGPYEIIKRWLDTPTTKSIPENLEKQYKDLLEEHNRMIKLIEKERKVLEDAIAEFSFYQANLQRSEKILQLSMDKGEEVTARQAKEHRNLRTREQYVKHQYEKSRQMYRALLCDEVEFRTHLKKEMNRIEEEMLAFEKARVDIANSAFYKFASILNHQEIRRGESRTICSKLTKTASPLLVSLEDWNDKSFIYSSNIYTDDFKHFEPTVECKKTPVQHEMSAEHEMSEVPVSKSQDSLRRRRSSTSVLSTGDKSDNGTPVVPFTEDPDKQNKRSKARRARRRKNARAAEVDEPSCEKPYQTEKAKEKSETDVEMATDIPSEKPKRKSRRAPRPPMDSPDSEAEMPKGKHGMYKNEESAANTGLPPRRPTVGWVSKEDVRAPSDVGDAEIVPAPQKNIRLALLPPLALEALVSHVATDDSQLDFKKGQKVTQTHEINDDGVAYGYTRKHSYSRVKHGYFHVAKMTKWKLTTKKIIKEMF